MANKKEKRYTIEYVLQLAGNVSCKDLPHPEKHQHTYEEICPSEYHRDRQLHLLRGMLKELNL